MFGQTFALNDLVIIGLLIVLEGVLSIDNALVLGLLAKRLPKHLQGRALTYGLVGAFLFRLIAIAAASYLLRWRIVKLLGGAYLVYVAVKHFAFGAKGPEGEHVPRDSDGQPIPIDRVAGVLAEKPRSVGIPGVSRPKPQPPDASLTPAPVGVLDRVAASPSHAGFWPTVAVIELTDIAFAIDSILAAIALVGSPPERYSADAPHPKLWVVVAGGMLGVILMRFAAVVFIKMLERFPRFEMSAYLLVLVIGLKLVIDWAFNSEAHPHRVDFHDFHGLAFWAFWGVMMACFATGFIPQREKAGVTESPSQR